MRHQFARPMLPLALALPSAFVFTILTLGPLPSPTVPAPGDPTLDPLAPLGPGVGTDLPVGPHGTVRDAP